MTAGLLLTAFGFGLRHGLDFDHLAAISDISSSTRSRRRAFVLSTLYALGHAVVVAVLGAVLLVAGARLPHSLDDHMGRVVGATLVLLGGWVVVELVRRRRNFVLRSRWMLVLDGVFAGIRRVRRRRAGRVIELEHRHAHEHAGEETVHDHPHGEAVGEPSPAMALHGPGMGAAGVERPAPRSAHAHAHSHAHRHTHRHTHSLVLADGPSAGYGRVAATGIGVVHGIGMETPTQVAAFVALTGTLGTGGGVMVLVVWVLGLLAANTSVAAVAAWGLARPDVGYRVYAALGAVVAAVSIGFGLMLVLG